MHRCPGPPLPGLFDAAWKRAARPAFDKALALDPLNARIVWGSFVHFRTVGDQEMVTLLLERLAQIAPEKGEDKRLGKATGFYSLFTKLMAFSETADQDCILAFQDELDSKAGLYDTAWDQRFFTTTLWELNNNLDELLSLREDTPLMDNPNGFFIQNYVSTNRRLLLVQQSAGRTDMAQEWVDRLLNDRNETYNAYGLPGFSALAALDTDKAVELILAFKAQYPTWRGTDLIAIYQISNRDLILHPDMQAFYLQEGKWMDYLAERVPEYARFRQVQ